jgi:hypothetical protein
MSNENIDYENMEKSELIKIIDKQNKHIKLADQYIETTDRVIGKLERQIEMLNE